MVRGLHEDKGQAPLVSELDQQQRRLLAIVDFEVVNSIANRLGRRYRHCAATERIVCNIQNRMTKLARLKSYAIEN